MPVCVCTFGHGPDAPATKSLGGFDLCDACFEWCVGNAMDSWERWCVLALWRNANETLTIGPAGVGISKAAAIRKSRALRCDIERGKGEHAIARLSEPFDRVELYGPLGDDPAGERFEACIGKLEATRVNVRAGDVLVLSAPDASAAERLGCKELLERHLRSQRVGVVVIGGACEVARVARQSEVA